MLRRTLGLLALALSCLGLACDDGGDMLEPAQVVRLVQSRCLPQPMFCGRVSIRHSTARRLGLLEPSLLEAPKAGPFLRGSTALAATLGDGECRLQLTQFADAQ